MIERTSTRWSMLLDQSRMQRLNQDINDGRSRVDSGEKLLHPSDDPSTAARIAEIDRISAGKENDLRAITRLQTRWQTIDDQLSAMQKDTQRLLEIALAANTATASASDRATWALELASLRKSLLAAANARDTQGAPLFTSGQADAFVADSAGHMLWQDQGPIAEVDVGDGHFLPLGLRLHDFTGPPARPEDGDDLFAEIDRLEANLKAPAPDSSTLAAAITGLRRFTDQLADAQSQAGTYGARLLALSDGVHAHISQLGQSRSKLADTDVAAEIAAIDQNSLILDATRALFAKLRAKSLLDYLR